jgi:hypothetical protein
MAQGVSTRISLAHGGTCLAEGSIAPLGRLPRRHAVGHGDLIGKYKLRVAKIVVRGEELWADIRTGQLYHPSTLRCLSGPLRLLKIE